MRLLSTLAVLILLATLACSESEPDAPIVQSVTEIAPATGVSYIAEPYSGGIGMETIILDSDVIVRASFLGMSTSTAQFTSTEYPGWTPTLEFQFQVHEYLKGSGPNTITAITAEHLPHSDNPYTTQAEAEAAVSRFLEASYDSHWENRQALLFLYNNAPDLDLSAPDRFWIGGDYMPWSREAKRWLPAVATLTRSTRNAATASTDDILFLTDAPHPEYRQAQNSGSGTARATQTSGISLSEMKALVTSLETEANVGGSAAYRACIEMYYWFEHGMRHTGASPPRDPNLEIMSGLPAGTLLRKGFGQALFHEIPDPVPDNIEGRVWFEGADAHVARSRSANVEGPFTFGPAPLPYSYTYDSILETSRPLPAGVYEFVGKGVSLYMVCDKDFSLVAPAVNRLSVTPPERALHEAFFDPVDIGDAVGADSSNGVLKPTDFMLNGTNTTISSLKWEDGAVSMTLNPTASLADYAIDFIDVNGTTTLSLTSDYAGTTALTWTVPDKPWSDGDLLMLRIHKPISSDATLSALTLSGVDLTFDPDTTTYTASVPATTTQTTVTPTANHDSATYHVKLGEVVDDDGTIPLAAGANVITIEVTAEDAVTTQTYTVTVTRATPSAPVTVTLAPRVEGSNTCVNITIEWNDPQPCDGRYMVALYTSSDYFVQLLGFRTASETASITTESATDWDLSRFPDWFAGVSCHPSGLSAQTRELGRVSLRAAHPDNN